MNDMDDNLASPLHHFADNTTTHSAIPKYKDPTQAFLSLHIDLYEIESGLINLNTSKIKEL